MKRRLFSTCAAALAALAMAPHTFAQGAPAIDAWAEGPFTVISPFPAGGPTDTLARTLADGLSKRYGQTAVVENVAGAAGNIGMEKVKRAKGNGHTLLVIPAGNLTVNPTLMPNFPFDLAKDFVPITMLAKAPNVVVASPASGLKSVADLEAWTKAKPGTLSYASPGVGSQLHLAGELVKQKAGLDMLHVAYKGTTPALNDALAGVVPLVFSSLPTALPFIRSGKLVAIGITQTERSPVAPDIPTLAEQGIQGVNVTSWYGLLAPAGTPAGVVEQLARDAAQILAQSEVQQRLSAQGLMQATMSPAEFAAVIERETAMWAEIIKSRGIKME